MGKRAEEVTTIDWDRDRTVHCIFDNVSLKNCLQNWAQDNDYRLIWGQPNSPDIIAFPCIVIIVDRNYLGLNAYENYLEYTKEVNEPFELSELSEDESNDVKLIEALTSKDDTVCIIIDNLRNIEHPMLDNVFQINPKQNKAFKWITAIIQSIDQFQ